MPKVCDHTSVGIVIKDRAGRILMIKRKNYPQAYALPAGHCDGDSPGTAINREVKEEVGIDVACTRTVFSGVVANPCKRDGGNRHHWEVYSAVTWSGEPKAGSDAKECFWASLGGLKAMALRAEHFIRKYSGGHLPKDILDISAPFELTVSDDELAMDHFTMSVGHLTRAIFGHPQSGGRYLDPEWKEGMGLEPVWYYLLKQTRIL